MNSRRFPLPLSSLAATSVKPAPLQARVSTPSTATQNAAHSAAQNRHSGPQPVALPSNGHGHAMARTPPVHGYPTAQTLPAAAVNLQRGDPLVSDAVRRAMVARVAQQGVKDAVVLSAMQAVPRHLFVEQGLASQAYIDASLPIGQHQTISQPYIVARMIEVMRNGASLKRVLEIGTGCGYQAAVLALVAQDVFSIERVKSLHQLARDNLRSMRVPNLRLQYGDGMLGLPQAAPFDGIILAAAGLEVPQALLDQLTIGGRLVAPVGAHLQHLQLISRVGKMEWLSETLEDCHFVPLRAGTV